MDYFKMKKQNLIVRLFIFALIVTSTLYAEANKENRDSTFAVRFFNVGLGDNHFSSELLPFVMQKKISDNAAVVLSPNLFYQDTQYVHGVTDYGFTLAMPVYSQNIDDINMFEGFYYGPGLYYNYHDEDIKYDNGHSHRDNNSIVCAGINIGYGWSFWEKGFFAFDLIVGYKRQSGFSYESDNSEGFGAVGKIYLGWELF